MSSAPKLPPLVVEWDSANWSDLVDCWIVATNRMFDDVEAGATWRELSKRMPREVEPGLMPLGELMASAFAMGMSMGSGKRRSGANSGQ